MSDGATEALLEERMWEETDLLKASQASLLRRSLENDDDQIPEYHSDKINVLQTQVGGDHYRKMRIQPIEYILANELGFCEGNIIKYISRYKEKGTPKKDLEKIKQYCDFLIAGLE